MSKPCVSTQRGLLRIEERQKDRIVLEGRERREAFLDRCIIERVWSCEPRSCRGRR